MDLPQITMTTPDGQVIANPTPDDIHAAVERGFARTPMRETAADVAVRDRTYAVPADELRQFIERAEQLAAEKRDIADQVKEVFAEAKGRGYDTKAIRKVIALRKRKPEDVAEEQAVLDLYLSALGMA